MILDIELLRDLEALLREPFIDVRIMGHSISGYRMDVHQTFNDDTPIHVTVNAPSLEGAIYRGTGAFCAAVRGRNVARYQFRLPPEQMAKTREVFRRLNEACAEPHND